MTMNIRSDLIAIRPVGEESLADLLAVYKGCEDFLALGPVAAASLEMVRSDLDISKREGGTVCGIFLPEEPMIGIADFVPRNFRGQSEAAYIALLMVKKSFRNRGIGSCALEWIEAEIRRDQGVSRIQAGVQVNNPSAIRFWQARGFEIISGPERLADQTTVYRLEKNTAFGAGQRG
jgi:ribosomal protein S18 acetylase RimI-like enzyme